MSAESDVTYLQQAEHNIECGVSIEASLAHASLIRAAPYIGIPADRWLAVDLHAGW